MAVLLVAFFSFLLCVGCRQSNREKLEFTEPDSAMFSLYEPEDEIPKSDEPDTAAAVYTNTPISVTIPLLGEKYVVELYNSDNPSYPFDGTISDDSVISMRKLSDDLEICWFLLEDAPNCAYRRYGGSWVRFLTEGSTYREGFDAGLFADLFGKSGFFITAPRGAAYTAYDYYYFDANGKLGLLFSGTHSDAIGDFNSDGINDLLWFTHAGRVAEYYYSAGEDIYRFDIIAELTSHFSDWEYICADPWSIRSDTWAENGAHPEAVNGAMLRVNFRRGGVDHSALIGFGQDVVLVRTY